MSDWLRRDLEVIPMPGGRTCVVVDEVGGRFARVSRRIWERLASVNSPSPAVFGAAVQAGWARRRDDRNNGDRFHPLSFRVRLLSIDPLARRCVAISGVFFSPRAIGVWLVALFLGTVTLLLRWDQFVGGLPTLDQWLASSSLLSVAVTFVATKTIHELGHAVMCRRLGSRCGTLGIWFLMGLPCPFVDVTDVWRQPTPLRRAAVMAAGIWMEWIVATIACWVWIASIDPAIRLTAMNVMLVCGVSTLLFNANPLMRYDGYFIVSDLIDSTNLRRDARGAMTRLSSSATARKSGPTWLMSGYHVASLVYRVVIAVAIAGLMLAWSESVGAWRLMIVGLFVLAMIRSQAMLKAWSARRRWIVGVSALVLMALLSVPFPRGHRCDGVVEADATMDVFLPRSGIVASVNVQKGDRVTANQTLATIDDADLRLELAETRGRLAVWRYQSRAVRLASLTDDVRSRDGDDWQAIDAALDANQTIEQQLQRRLNECRVVSTIDGIVLGPPESLPRDERNASVATFELSPHAGQPSDDRKVWCRIASKASLRLMMQIDAADAKKIDLGQSVEVILPVAGSKSYWSTIESISPAEQVDRNKHRSHWNSDQHWVQVTCRLSDDRLTLDDLPLIEGATGHATITCQRRRLLDDCGQWILGLLGI